MRKLISSLLNSPLETRLDLLMDLARAVPEWIAVKELSGQGKILKFAPNLNAFQVTQLIQKSQTASRQ